MKNKLLLFLLLFILDAAIHPAQGQSVRIENLKAEILLKLLSQNRSLDFAGIDTVRFTIVYDRTDSGSQNAAENYRRIFSIFPNPPFKGKPLRVEKQPNNRLNNIDWGKITAIVIIPGKNMRIAEILQRCENSQVLSMATDSTFVGKGVSAAVEIGSNLQPVICFNLNSLKSEGAVYDAKILQLAKYMVWE